LVFVPEDEDPGQLDCHSRRAAVSCLLMAKWEVFMTESLTPFIWLLVQIVLVILAIGLPIVFVLAIRFLWDRKVNLDRSKELEKLIWQLHRIASAMEHQMNLTFPAVQPGTEEPRDLAYLQRHVTQTAAAAPSVAAARPAVNTPANPQPVTAQPAPQPAAEQVPVVEAPASQQPAIPALERRDPSVEAPRAGVNSMFGL
jgi:cytoskeletal protein RodZ